MPADNDGLAVAHPDQASGHDFERSKAKLAGLGFEGVGGHVGYMKNGSLTSLIGLSFVKAVDKRK